MFANARRKPPTFPAAAADANPGLRVLLIEDSKADAYLVKRMLQDNIDASHLKISITTLMIHALDSAFKHGQRGIDDQGCNITNVARLSDAIAYAASMDYDAVILDLSLPDTSGVSAIIALQAVAPALPIIVYSGTTDPAVHAAARTWGATQVLVKGDQSGARLKHALQHVVNMRACDRA